MLELNGLDYTTTRGNHLLNGCVISSIIPIRSSVDQENITSHIPLPKAPLPFTSTFNLSSFLQAEEKNSQEEKLARTSCSSGLRDSIILTARNEGGIDDVLVSALGSISMKPERSKALFMSHEQKSKRILQHCSSWTQLDDTRVNHGLIHGKGKKHIFFQLDRSQMLNQHILPPYSDVHNHSFWRKRIHSYAQNKCGLKPVVYTI